MTFEEMNKKLREAAELWVKERLEHYMSDAETDCDENGCYKGINEDKTDMYLSCPFYMGVTEDYALQTKSRRVMIVGQEARHYGIWKDDKNRTGYVPIESQEWAIEYLLCQLNSPKQNSRFNHSYNKSRFWQTFRTLYKNDINVCWNNIDKVYYSKGNKDYKGTLTYDGEEYLSAPYGTDNKSLLRREIEITKPDAILFVTGPTYYLSMATALGVSSEMLKGKLKKNNSIVDIKNDLCVEIPGVDIPVLWTYHPANQIGVNSAKKFLEIYNR